jgi:hypothetical protein
MTYQTVVIDRTDEYYEKLEKAEAAYVATAKKCYQMWFTQVAQELDVNGVELTKWNLVDGMLSGKIKLEDEDKGWAPNFTARMTEATIKDYFKYWIKDFVIATYQL